MATQMLSDIVDTGDFYSVMERVNEYEEDLWDTWSDKREDAFEPVLRQTVQEIEHVKNLHAEYNISIQYLMGKLDGWTEVMERLHRTGESIKKAAEELSSQSIKARQIMECLYKNKEGMRHGELAAAIGSSDSSLTNIMKRVLLSGAVESVRSGKNTIYYLSDVGRRYCQEQDREGQGLKTFIRDCINSSLAPLRENIQQIADALSITQRATTNADLIPIPRSFTPVLNDDVLEPVEIGAWLTLENQDYVKMNTIDEEKVNTRSSYVQQGA